MLYALRDLVDRCYEAFKKFQGQHNNLWAESQMFPGDQTWLAARHDLGD